MVKGGTLLKKDINFIIILFVISLIAAPLYAGVIYSNNFDNEKVGCWNDVKKQWRSNCGDFYGIGSYDRMKLSTAHVRSGTYAALQTAKYNENRGQAYIQLADPMSQTSGYDELYIRIWNYFTGDDGTYDHGWQPKIMRVYSSDGSKTAFDIVSCLMDLDGDRDSEYIKVAFNGGPVNWGQPSGSYRAPNNQWVSFELHIKLNTPGLSNGLVELFVDGDKKVSKSNINIRGNYKYKMNRVLVGGWYSNGGVNSDQNNYRYMDDLVISTEYIGNSSSSTSNSSTTSNIPPVPPAPTGIRVEASIP
jgi:hypothetical protein